MLKTISLFIVFEGLLLAFPLRLGQINAFGILAPKRERFPVSTSAPVDAALDVGNLDAMFASHVISSPKGSDEYRVLVFGDSTIWGLQLSPDEVLPGQLNRLDLRCNGKVMRFYNLSFPRSSATKDLLILDRAMRLQPDAIVWLITWYTLMPKTRVDHWLIEQNPDDYQRLAERFGFLPRDYRSPNVWGRLFRVNSAVFRTVRFELYSVMELATGRDQIPGPPQVRATSLSSDPTFEGLKPPTLRKNQVSLDQVEDFYSMAGGVPVLLVNEPILRMEGIPNSDVRYNSYYPRWVYDQYRTYLQDAATASKWHYLDLWDQFPSEDFADTPLHLRPAAHRILAETLVPEILSSCK